MALVKDNHISAVKDIKSAVAKIRKYRPSVKVEVECDTFKQVGEAISASADIIMLDNMTPAEIRKSVSVIRKHKGVEIEISGGVNLGTVAKFAKLGADRISVGALTHSAPALDIGLDIKE